MNGTSESANSVDVLSDVLSWLRVEGTLTRRSKFSAPWRIAYAPTNLLSFMAVERGDCFLTCEGQDSARLEAGDLLMFSPGQIVSLGDHPSTEPVPYNQVLAAFEPNEDEEPSSPGNTHPTLEYGGGGRRTTITGWGLRFESREQHPLLSLLPPYVRITAAERSAHPWLDTTFRFITHETHGRSDGSDMMIRRLVELLFVQLVRTWFREHPHTQAGLLGALRDTHVRRALKLVHRDPAHPWTVETLAKAVGMSRSGLSARFQSLMGISPLKYVTQVRMHVAATALTDDARATLSEISQRVGYDTESSFGRAFKRYFGVSPGAFRKRSAGQR